MKAPLSFITLLLITTSLSAQILTVQGGVSRSSLNWKLFNGSKIYKKPITGTSFAIGLDYAQHKYFNLSSNVGTFRKGGRENLYYADPYGMPMQGPDGEATFDYITFNTTIDLKYPNHTKLYPFVSAGPRLDIHIHNSEVVRSFRDNDELNKIIFGLIAGAGVKYQLNKVELGLRGNYLLNFTPIAEYNNANGTPSEVKDKTFLINLSAGVKL